MHTQKSITIVSNRRKRTLVMATYGETVPSLKSIPVKAGYDFAGFYTEEGEEYYDAAGNGKVIWLGAKDIRLKAAWTAKRLTISFDVNGGDTELASIEGTYLDKYPALPTPTRQGYSFAGWTVENDASGNYVTADTVISNPDAHTLVAQWENGTNTQYTVERYVEKAADGNSDGTDTETKYVLYDKSTGYGTTNEDVVINASLYGIAGYAFDGNNSQNVLTGTIKADGSTVFALYYNIKPADYFTVTYDYGREDMPSKTQYVKLVHVTGGAQGNLRFRAVWSEDKLVFSATLYDRSPETYIYYYPAAGSEKITLAQIAVPVREGYVFSYWTKKIPKSTYGYYDVVLRDDTKVSTLNFNTDFVTANWMPLVTTDGFDGYQICVSSEKELELAIEYIKSDSRYTGIALSNDITINELSEPLFEIFDAGYVLLGNNHKLTLKRAAAPLFGENHGEIRELGIVGNVNNSVDSAKAEETGFGVIAGVNKGIIKGCFIEGVSTDDGVTRNTITSNAAYFGGLVGINEGTITECRISDINVIWNDTAAVSDSNYIGGFAGKNDNNGTITNSSMTSATVSVKSGYDINTSHRLYIGGYAGMNQGMISDSTVAGSRIGNEYLVSSDNVAYMSAGGFAGIDAVSGSAADVRGISGVTISDTEIRSESVAGGIIGENNYALIEKASLTNVYVYGGREYAGQLAGINRSTADAEGYCYYTNARTQTKTGTAGVIAGLCEKPAAYKGMNSIIAVRTNDNKTTVINGDEYTNYGKGAFFYEFRNDKVWIQFYDIKNLAEKW